MKTLLAGLVLCVSAASSFAQTPDPRDSIILESKTVAPQVGPSAGQPIMRVRMFITNKDSLISFSIIYEERTLSGGAYATLGRSSGGSGPRSTSSIATLLPHPQDGQMKMNNQVGMNLNRYNSNSPDTFVYVGTYDGVTDENKEPPNLMRRALLEIKFDSVTGTGQIQLDTARSPGGGVPNTRLERSPDGVPVPFNFVKAILTVPAKGDLSLDSELSAQDVIMLLNCVFLGIAPEAGSVACDLDCSGVADATDVILLLNAVFLGDPFPC